MKDRFGMSRSHLIWLWFKRTFKVGWFKTIVADKCNSYFTDKDCPNKATISEYHRGQFGHKIQFQFCDSCYTKYNDWKKTEWAQFYTAPDRPVEKLK